MAPPRPIRSSSASSWYCWSAWLNSSTSSSSSFRSSCLFFRYPDPQPVCVRVLPKKIPQKEEGRGTFEREFHIVTVVHDDPAEVAAYRAQIGPVGRQGGRRGLMAGLQSTLGLRSTRAPRAGPRPVLQNPVFSGRGGIKRQGSRKPFLDTDSEI